MADQGQPTYGLDVDFPLLWGAAQTADDRERLGQKTHQGEEESARAMHELWDARRGLRAAEVDRDRAVAAIEVIEDVVRRARFEGALDTDDSAASSPDSSPDVE